MYTGVGFPVAVQFKMISAPSIRSTTSGSGLMNAGGKYTEALRGSEVTVGGGCGPSGPSSSSATHLYCAPFSALVGTITRIEDTWTGEEDVRSEKEWL